MTEVQFNALYKLATPLVRKPECEDAMRLVFLEGMGIRQAAAKTGITFAAVSIASKKMRDAIKLSYTAVTGQMPNDQEAQQQPKKPKGNTPAC